jgi:hypothetical protein
MNDWLRSARGSSDELGRDMVLAEAFDGLDPATGDPNYWLRFRGWVMTGAAGELARRRLMAQLTVGDVLTSWARTVVPTAVLAAALAGLLMLRSTEPNGPDFIGLEELLVSEIPGETVPVLLTPEGTEGVVAFAAEIF